MLPRPGHAGEATAGGGRDQRSATATASRLRAPPPSDQVPGARVPRVDRGRRAVMRARMRPRSSTRDEADGTPGPGWCPGRHRRPRRAEADSSKVNRLPATARRGRLELDEVLVALDGAVEAVEHRRVARPAEGQAGGGADQRQREHRSGWSSAAAWQTMPPMDTPSQWASSTPAASSTARARRPGPPARGRHGPGRRGWTGRCRASNCATGPPRRRARRPTATRRPTRRPRHQQHGRPVRRAQDLVPQPHAARVRVAGHGTARRQPPLPGTTR